MGVRCTGWGCASDFGLLTQGVTVNLASSCYCASPARFNAITAVRRLTKSEVDTQEAAKESSDCAYNARYLITSVKIDEDSHQNEGDGG